MVAAPSLTVSAADSTPPRTTFRVDCAVSLNDSRAVSAMPVSASGMCGTGSRWRFLRMSHVIAAPASAVGIGFSRTVSTTRAPAPAIAPRCCCCCRRGRLCDCCDDDDCGDCRCERPPLLLPPPRLPPPVRLPPPPRLPPCERLREGDDDAAVCCACDPPEDERPAPPPPPPPLFCPPARPCEDERGCCCEDDRFDPFCLAMGTPSTFDGRDPRRANGRLLPPARPAAPRRFRSSSLQESGRGEAGQEHRAAEEQRLLPRHDARVLDHVA